MIKKEKKIFRKMFIVTEYAALKLTVCLQKNNNFKFKWSIVVR